MQIQAEARPSKQRTDLLKKASTRKHTYTHAHTVSHFPFLTDCEEWAKGVGGGGSGIGEEGAELFTDNKSVLNLQDDVQGSKGAEAKIGLLQGGIIFFKSCFGCGILGMPAHKLSLSHYYICILVLRPHTSSYSWAL